MPSQPEGIKISGMAELRRELKKIEPKWIDEIKKANFDLVDQLIVPKARQRAREALPRPGAGATHAGNAVVSSIRSLRQAKAAIIQFGGSKVPYAGGYEFGSLQQKKTKRGGHTTQFPIWRGNGEKAGYFIWPTIREASPEFISRYMEFIDRLLSMPFDG